MDAKRVMENYSGGNGLLGWFYFYPSALLQHSDTHNSAFSTEQKQKQGKRTPPIYCLSGCQACVLVYYTLKPALSL